MSWTRWSKTRQLACEQVFPCYFFPPKESLVTGYTSTRGADCYRLLALITIMAVKLQMSGGETCHVHVNVRPRGSRKQQTKTTYAARARTLNRFKQNYHGGQGFAPLAHSLLGSVNSKRAHPPSGICRAFVILFWKSYKCPMVGPGVYTKTPRWGLKIGCKWPTRDNTKIAVSSK